jgi:hypothetical protein
MTKQEAFSNNRRIWLEIARMVDNGEFILPIGNDGDLIDINKRIFCG